MKSCDCPLVSVAVITYNSSKTVVETLDSIFNQTYPKLELIVSDDCSTDNTVEICRKWIEAHKERFVRTELLTVENNKGVSGNMNRAEANCRGEWVKGIAGDDVLLPECVEVYIQYVVDHPEAVYVFSRVKIFGGDEDRRKKWNEFFIYEFFGWDLDKQYDFLTLERNCIPAASSFYNRKSVELLGVEYDERIPLLEDWPRWISLIKRKVRFHFIDKTLVMYRMSDSALSTRETQSIAYERSYCSVYKYYCFCNDYRKGSKKDALYRYLRCEKVIHDESLFWGVICKLYKIIVLHRL